MTIERNQSVLRHLRAIYDGAPVSGESDRDLLERFLTRSGERAERAFAVLVERHGAMVLKVCRAVLRDEHEAHDAFQAVFLVLVHKARGLGVRDSLGPWLHAVALRVTACARASAARRRVHERRSAAMRPRAILEEVGDDLSVTVHEEVGRLPEPLRAVLVLCDLEGLTHEQAARSLDWPIGTVKSRQARGREKLRSRLARRGFAPTAGLSSLLLVSEPTTAALIQSTSQAAVRLARGGGSAGITSAAVAVYTRGVVRAMFIARLRLVSCTLLLLGSVAIPTGVAVQSLARADDPPPKAVTAPSKPIRDILREAQRKLLSTQQETSLAYVLAEIARAQVRAGDLEGAQETGRRASEAAMKIAPSTRGNALVAVAYARAAAGDRLGGLKDLKEAEESASEIRTDLGKVRAWLLVAEAQADLGDRAAATATIQIMSGVAFAIHEAGQAQMGRLMALTDVAKAYAWLGDYEGAFRTVETIDENNARWRGTLLGAIANVAARRSGWYLQPPKQPLAPNERQDRLRVVKRVLEMVEKHEFAAEKPYQDLAMDLIALGDCDEALRIIRRIGTDPVQHPHPVDLAGKIDLLGSLAVALNKAGRGDEARKVLREALVSVEGDPKLANRRGFIAFYQARMGDGDGALQTLEAVDFDERVQVLSEIADEQLKAGNVEKAKTTLRRALGAVEKQLEDPVSGAQRKGLVEVDGNGRPRPATIDPAVFKDRYLGRLAGFQARVGNLSGAVQTLAKITSEHDRGMAVGDIAQARTRAGDAEGALTWVLSFHSSVERLRGLRGLAQGVTSP